MKYFLTTFLLITFHFSFSQVDNYQKNKKIYDSLKAKYDEELKANPKSALPHWNYAKALEKLTFRASEQAPKYYMKAIEIDSTNARIYQDLGDYFFKDENLRAAYYCYNKGLELDANNKALMARKAKVDIKFKEIEEYWRLHQLPEYKGLDDAHKPKMSFKELTNFPKLFKETQKGKFSYGTLSKIFEQKPDQLNPKQMFYLLIGQTQQKYYKPYNYNDEKRMQQLIKAQKIKEAISFGESLVKVELVNMLILRELMYCYRKTGQKMKALAIEMKLSKIFEGVLFSGNGSCERPFIILSVQEEYLFCSYLGYRPLKASQARCAGQMTDKMLVKNANKDQSFVYFNYTPIYLVMRDK